MTTKMAINAKDIFRNQHRLIRFLEQSIRLCSNQSLKPPKRHSCNRSRRRTSRSPPRWTPNTPVPRSPLSMTRIWVTSSVPHRSPCDWPRRSSCSPSRTTMRNWASAAYSPITCSRSTTTRVWADGSDRRLRRWRI
ncbi:GD17124 [Drosophila simulans]|uniref:GD17124 n=1 Tax=Drosophila simulans TaxID=7240 RepID=B4R4C4_DROSI|nr:GD17124 [Drosophila simulans]